MKKTLDTLILLFLFGSIQAQSSQSFAETILGTWNGTGTLFGQEATFHMKWENSLNAKFIKLTFSNTFGENRTMDANAYYRLEQHSGYWFDSRGTMLPLQVDIDSDTMTVLWGNEATENGKTIYTIVDSEHLTVQDFVLKEGTYIKFGEAIYRRAGEN